MSGEERGHRKVVYYELLLLLCVHVRVSLESRVRGHAALLRPEIRLRSQVRIWPPFSMCMQTPCLNVRAQYSSLSVICLLQNAVCLQPGANMFGTMIQVFGISDSDFS